MTMPYPHSSSVEFGCFPHFLHSDTDSVQWFYPNHKRFSPPLAPLSLAPSYSWRSFSSEYVWFFNNNASFEVDAVTVLQGWHGKVPGSQLQQYSQLSHTIYFVCFFVWFGWNSYFSSGIFQQSVEATNTKTSCYPKLRHCDSHMEAPRACLGRSLSLISFSFFFFLNQSHA